MGKIEIEITKGYDSFLHGQAASIKIIAEDRKDLDENLKYIINAIRWWY
jgi:hypothetical protein